MEGIKWFRTLGGMIGLDRLSEFRVFGSSRMDRQRQSVDHW